MFIAQMNYFVFPCCLLLVLNLLIVVNLFRRTRRINGANDIVGCSLLCCLRTSTVVNDESLDEEAESSSKRTLMVNSRPR